MNFPLWAGEVALLGVLSFVSPCVFPLIPSYLSYLAGVSVFATGSEGGKTKRWATFGHALAFVAGFSILFVLMGAGASQIGEFLKHHRRAVQLVGGQIIVLFGLHYGGWLNLSFLQREARFDVQLRRGVWSSGLMGAVFGLGWTPCLGAILGAVLGLASQTQTVYLGMLLLLCYSLGLGIPLLLAALAMEKFLGWWKGFKKHLRTISVIAGILLILTGELMIFGKLSLLSRAAQKAVPDVSTRVEEHLQPIAPTPPDLAPPPPAR